MANEQWHADIEITITLAQAMIANQFPSLSPIKIDYIGEGWDNKVFMVNDQYVFRFPHRKIAASLIERENAVLIYLQNRIDLQIPEPLFIGSPTSDYPYDFHGYHAIKGKSGCHAELSLAARRQSIVAFAQFLKQLHSITDTMARSIGAKAQFFDRTKVIEILPNLRERIDKIHHRNIISIDKTVFDKELAIAAMVTLPKTNVLVHGDLYCRHLIFDHQQLVGIIDWGDVGINSPAVDLAGLFSFYPEACQQTFFEIYGHIDEQTLAYARFLGLYSAVSMMLYGHDINDIYLVKEAHEALRRINPRLLAR